MNILFVASEAVPFAKTGGLADVAGTVPRIMAAEQTTSLIIPDYQTEPIRALGGKTVDSFDVSFGSHSYHAVISQADVAPRFTAYFVSHPAFFARDFLYGDANGDYPDNLFRFFFFQSAVVEFIRRRKLIFDVIHCHDWQAAMVPLLVSLATAEPFFRKSKLIFSIHNLGYQGVFPGSHFAETGLPEHLFSPEYLEFYGQLNFMKAGIIFSDWLLTVSPTYAREILRPEGGFGLDGLLNHFSSKLSGILNGVDYSQWNPETDRFIDHPYSWQDLETKNLNKLALYRELAIPTAPQAPLLVMIARISEQKGLRLLVDLLPQLLKETVHFIFLGCGDTYWTEKLHELAAQFPENFTFLNRFDERMAHRLEAAGDIFFMPSLYEPCGLNQLYSMKYGTVPIVRATGGLDDSVTEFDSASGGGSGFKFAGDQVPDVMPVLAKALGLFRDPPAWRQLQQNGMRLDFSWGKVVGEYVKLYNQILREDVTHG